MIFSARLQLKETEGELDVGTHTFEFEYELPEALPSSFEDDGSAVGMLGTLVIPSEGFMPKSFGKDKSFIRYVINAFVDKEPMQPLSDKDSEDNESSDDQNDSKAKKEKKNPHQSVLMSTWQAFRVWQKVVCKDDQIVSVTGTKKFMFGKLPTELTVSLPHGANVFVGTGVLLRLTINNPGSKAIESVRLSMSDTLVLKSNTSRLARSTSLTTGVVPNSSVAAGSVWHRDALLPIPAQTGPSIGDDAATFIQHDYVLKVEIAGGMMSTLAVNVPVTVWGGSAVLAGIAINALPTLSKPSGNDKDDDNEDNGDKPVAATKSRIITKATEKKEESNDVADNNEQHDDDNKNDDVANEQQQQEKKNDDNVDGDDVDVDTM
eukprot:CAMPEP_0168599404 /NCGR_PEP_ID=MMETSP0420-20121227/12049_1 /TAXON_ID=498008 /ORGANISM="Pessonella sp." /LENGTH=376 /DNA_ID=CAMNT_0008637059 /DNA_START=219 /DNA_END=1346 /DNA_ORIENTATION=+